MEWIVLCHYEHQPYTIARGADLHVVHVGAQVSSVGAGGDLAGAALAALRAAHELVATRPGGAGGRGSQTRLAYQLGAHMAREQLVAQDPASARRILLSVAGAPGCSWRGAPNLMFAAREVAGKQLECQDLFVVILQGEEGDYCEDETLTSMRSYCCWRLALKTICCAWAARQTLICPGVGRFHRQQFRVLVH